jgi:hypothetical protein
LEFWGGVEYGSLDGGAVVVFWFGVWVDVGDGGFVAGSLGEGEVAVTVDGEDVVFSYQVKVADWVACIEVV